MVSTSENDTSSDNVIENQLKVYPFQPWYGEKSHELAEYGVAASPKVELGYLSDIRQGDLVYVRPCSYRDDGVEMLNINQLNYYMFKSSYIYLKRIEKSDPGLTGQGIGLKYKVQMMKLSREFKLAGVLVADLVSQGNLGQMSSAFHSVIAVRIMDPVQPIKNAWERVEKHNYLWLRKKMMKVPKGSQLVTFSANAQSTYTYKSQHHTDDLYSSFRLETEQFKSVFTYPRILYVRSLGPNCYGDHVNDVDDTAHVREETNDPDDENVFIGVCSKDYRDADGISRGNGSIQVHLTIGCR